MSGTAASTMLPYCWSVVRIVSWGRFHASSSVWDAWWQIIVAAVRPCFAISPSNSAGACCIPKVTKSCIPAGVMWKTVAAPGGSAAMYIAP